MTDGATDTLEELLSLDDVCCLRQDFIARRNFRSSHKAGEMIDVRQGVRRGGLIIRFGDGTRITDRRHLRRKQSIRDSHLVKVSIAREREQARMLILPAETSDSGLVVGFKNWNCQRLAADFSVRGTALILRNSDKR